MWLMIHSVTPPNWNPLNNIEACVSLLLMNISRYWKSEFPGSREAELSQILPYVYLCLIISDLYPLY